MEATQSNGTKNESTTNPTQPQPQRERRPRRDKEQKPKTYYKTDAVPDGQSSDTSNPPNNSEASKEQTQSRPNAQKQQGSRSEKVYQPKAASSTTNSANGEAHGTNTAPKENGKPNKLRNPRNKQGGNQEGTKKNYQKKNNKEEEKESEKVGNERFDNSTSVDYENPSKDPHRALQVAQASRIQEIVPSGVSRDVVDKVKKIQEIIGRDEEFHIVYGVLEDLGYDEEKTVSYFLDRKTNGKQEVEEKVKEQKEIPATKQGWTNIVKKGITKTYGYYDEAAPENGFREPKGYQKPANGGQAYPARTSVFESLMGGTQMDPEDLVNNLSMAIATQLKIIQEQTRMLTVMQNELSNITQAGTSEREQLLNERELLKQREAELEAQLEDVRQRMLENDRLLELNQKKKAERISSITSNNLVASLLKKGPAPPLALPAPPKQQSPPPQQVKNQNQRGGGQAHRDQGQRDQGRYQNRRGNYQDSN